MAVTAAANRHAAWWGIVNLTAGAAFGAAHAMLSEAYFQSLSAAAGRLAAHALLHGAGGIVLGIVTAAGIVALLRRSSVAAAASPVLESRRSIE